MRLETIIDLPPSQWTIMDRPDPGEKLLNLLGILLAILSSVAIDQRTRMEMVGVVASVFVAVIYTDIAYALAQSIIQHLNFSGGIV